MKRSVWERLYLVRCFRYNKPMFLVILAFIALSFYGHRTSCEITPALDFAMYSRIRPTRMDSFLILAVDGRLLDLHHTIDEPRRMMIFSSLASYRQGQQAGNNDPARLLIETMVRKHPFMRPLGEHAWCKPADYQAYLPWLLGYLQNSVDTQIKHIDIRQLNIVYDSNNLPIPQTTKNLYQFEQVSVK